MKNNICLYKNNDRPLHISTPKWCGIGTVENRDFQVTHKIKVFKEDI